jgi:class 3 adenylate cyclase/DNA-binding CsgD family transcriptional regulator/tetratricopeptide (TPR) repeat protein
LSASAVRETSAALPTGTVTFLFTDIEGSTRLLKGLGRDRYGEVLATHNRLLRAAFSEAGGLEIETKGDSFFVVFPSAGSAVEAAGAAQRALASREWPDGAEVRVRMGLHTGEASVGSDGYVGFAVHQASRIGDAGHGGQVLLSSTTANLVRHELPPGLGLRDLGETALPDFDRPERLYQLEVEGLPGQFPPLSTRERDKAKPRMPRRRTDVPVATTPLLEREAELAALHAVVDAASSGVGRVVAIEGRAGMGKTRLVAEARSLAGSAGFEVLVARSADLEQEFAYGVVRQLFEPFLASLPPAERDEALSGTAALAQRIFGDEELTGAASGDVSFAVLHGLYWLAANIAARRPTAIVVDDLHWTDEPTLRWLSFLGRRLEGLPLLVVLGLRPPEQGLATELLTELVSDPTVLVIRPTAISEAGVASMVEREFGVAPDPAFASACHSATGGNPLFVRALVDALHGEGVAPTAEHARRVHEIGPEPVTRAVSLRLSRLPDEARRFANAAAVLGDGSEQRDVATLAEIDDRHLASLAATWLAQADLLRVTPPTVEFVHPVVRAAVYESVEPAQRLLAHRRAAELLGAAEAEPERVAAHLDLVPPARDAFVVETLRVAADRALVRGAPEVAVRYLRRALAEPPSEEARTDTLLELGLAERRVDISASAEHLQEALGAIDEPLRRVRVALELGRSLFRLNRGPEAVRIVEDAIERLDDDEVELRELLESELILSSAFDSDVIEVSRERIARVDESGLSGELGRAVMVSTLRYFDARRGVNREAVAALAEPKMLDALIESMPSVSISCAATALMYAEYDALVDRFFDAMMVGSKRRGELVTLSNMLCFRGLTLAQRGDLEAGIQDLRESDELVHYLPSQQGAIYFRSYLADALTNRGELDEAEHSLAQLGLAEEVAETGHLIFFLGARGWLRYARRDFAAAASDFERLGSCMEAFDMRNPAVLAWRSHLALALLRLGRGDEALELAREEVELARAWGAPRPLGVALRVQGLAEGGAEGTAKLRASLAVLERSSAKLERARTMVELGAALRRANARAEARELLKDGLDFAVRSGAQPLVDQAEEELAATGARPRRRLLSGVESLTASERRVARFAAEGLSNKDIAQTLFVTTKTVEVHLSSVYRKLGIGSRSELPQALGGSI